MRKENVTFLLFIFIFLSGYSQSDTTYASTRDTVINTEIAVASLDISKKKEETLIKKESVYKLKLGIDIPIIAVGTSWSVYAFTQIYKKTAPTEEQINNLKKSDVNAFDRMAIYPYSRRLYDLSNYPFYAAMPLPLIFSLINKETRPDFYKVTFLYWEAMSITGLTGTATTYSVDRYRPYTYTSETPMNQRQSGNPKNSFYAGHVQIVATPTFFIAKVFADYHPHSKIKWVYYGLAVVATGVTAYLRVIAGQHFMTDVLLGSVAGAAAGILVPQSHKIKSSKQNSLGIMPYSIGNINGLVLTYKLNK